MRVKSHTILIHTSVKLVTHERGKVVLHIVILIHTSVKLVTPAVGQVPKAGAILIHTSVKLVTLRAITNANILTF